MRFLITLFLYVAPLTTSIGCGDNCKLVSERLHGAEEKCNVYWPSTPIGITFDAEVAPHIVPAVNWAANHINSQAGCDILHVGPLTTSIRVIPWPHAGGRAYRSASVGEMTSCRIGVGHYNVSRQKDATPWVAVHELLHCLGFRHEEDNKDDIMYPMLQWTPQSISERDLTILEISYCP